jgi:predicted TIM-barrel fold metal-dependent hydrolase
MGHGGSSDYWYDVRPVMALADNVNLEISKVPPSGVFAVLNAHPTWASRILFGSNLPAAHYAAELSKIPSITDDPVVRAAIMGGNMARLLGEAQA